MELKINKDFQDLIPPLSEEEYSGLEASIIEEGCRDAIITWNGTIIDGHNRYKICVKSGIEFTTKERVFENETEAKIFIINNQFDRRNLSLYQRSLLVLKLEDIYSIEAKDNQKQSKGQGIKVRQICQTLNTRKKLAEKAKIGEGTLEKVKKIEQIATPELKEQIASGKFSIDAAYQQIIREEKIKEVQKTFVTKSTSSEDIFTTEKKYSIIYADPPWQYYEGGNKAQSVHYSTMSIEEISALPIKNITTENAILFLWVTFPILKECFKVIEAWGFEYSTCGFNWIKKNKETNSNFFGCGNWTRANSEICLIATKGSILRLDNSISQVVETKIEEHSKKPGIVRDLIIKLVGALPRIELFAREKIEGWDNWGNEA
jgi:N6-adenosine-specific RNA methylase IME4